ncbi:MAG: hypothetical protein ACJ786_12950 [Catenulispora sp.]
MSDQPVLAAVLDRISHVAPMDTLMWSGAGVSIEPPASLPSGWGLTRRTFDGLFELGALDRILSYHTALGWISEPVCPCQPAGRAGPRLPRLETVLGVAVRVTGPHSPAVLPRLLADVRDAQPNRLHRFFADHLIAGGRHVTANFDGCIERALPPSRSAADAGILHFHGSLAADPSGQSLGATLARIERGFPTALARQCIDRVCAARVLVIVGYSGSDFFDVDVAFAALAAGSLSRVRAVWVAHSDHPWHRWDRPRHGEPPLAGLLRAAGCAVEFACGPTADLLIALGRRWGFRDHQAPPPDHRPAPPTPPTIPRPARQAATFELYRQLGLHAEVSRMLRSVDLAGTPAIDVWRARSELLWEQGRWSTLRRRWWHSPDRISPVERAERIGACLWVQGRLMPAYLWLSWHRRRQPPGSQDQLVLAETEGRVIEHMARTPELRPLAQRLAARITTTLGATTQASGVHLYRRRNDLATSLHAVTTGQRRPADDARTSSSWFAETGNLLAALSYRHRQYRDSYRADLPTGEIAARYRELADQFRLLGSPAGAARTILLPGAERVFTVAELLQAVAGPQYGWWQRLRILAHYLALRARRPGRQVRDARG